MGKILLIICAVSLASILAEPPVGGLYLPPGQQPSSQYGAPSSVRFGEAGGISRQYGPPASSRFGGAGGISTQYGPPASSQFRGAGSISKQYGTSASSRFGGSGGISTQYRSPASSRFGGAGGLSTQYGAPVSSRFGGAGGLSKQYGTPSERFGGAGSLSAQYGAPSFGRFGSAGGVAPTFGAVGSANALSAKYGASGFGRAGGGYNYGRGDYNSEEDVLSEPANYEFSYEVDDIASGSEFGHDESRQDEDARGSYHVLLPDGRRQIVEYEADAEGYKPLIRYEVSGVGNYEGSRGIGGPY